MVLRVTKSIDPKVWNENSYEPFLDELCGNREYLSGISCYRTPFLAQMLKDYGLVDKLGRGLQKIVRHYSMSSLPPPEFDPSGDAFRVVIRRDRI